MSIPVFNLGDVFPAFYSQDLNKDLQDFVQEERQVTNGLSEDMRIHIGRVETVADVHTSWVWTYHRGNRRSVHCVSFAKLGRWNAGSKPSRDLFLS